MEIKEVIVVEGKSDTVKIKSCIQADTIETNGSEVSSEVLSRIEHAQAKRGVIVFTDPDYPGERIRRIVTEAVPGCKHAFLTQEEARAKYPAHKSLGIEHAKPEAIRQALSVVYEVGPAVVSEIHREDLLEYGLLAGAHARRRRAELGEILNVGHANGKQLLKRLGMFQITKKEFVAAMEQVLERESV